MKSKGFNGRKCERVLKEVLTDLARDYRPGDLFLSQREMIEHYNVSYTTINRVLRELKRRGAVDCKPGKGIFVADQASAGGVGQVSLSVFFPDRIIHDHSVWAKLQQGLFLAQTRLNCKIVYHSISSDLNEMYREFRDSGSKGIIFLEDNLYSFIDLVKDEGIPYIVIHPTGQKHSSSVDINDPKGIMDSARYLFDTGAKKIVYFSSHTNTPHNFEKVFAFRLELKRLGLSEESFKVVEMPKSDIGEMIDFVTENLRELGDGDGVFSVTIEFLDVMTAALKRFEGETKKRLNLVTFGDYQTGGGVAPVAGYVYVPYEEAVKAGVEMLVAQCERGVFEPSCKIIDSEFRIMDQK